jgi:hypothetical protein
MKIALILKLFSSSWVTFGHEGFFLCRSDAFELSLEAASGDAGWPRGTIGGSAPNAVDRMIRFYPHARGAESSVD